MTCQPYGSISNTDESKSNRYLSCPLLPFVLPVVLHLQFVFPPPTLSYPSFPTFLHLLYTHLCLHSVYISPPMCSPSTTLPHLVLIRPSFATTFLITLHHEFYTRLDPIFTPQLHLNSILSRTVLHTCRLKNN